METTASKLLKFNKGIFENIADLGTRASTGKLDIISELVVLNFMAALKKPSKLSFYFLFKIYLYLNCFQQNISN